MDFFIDYDGHWPQAWPPFKKNSAAFWMNGFPLKTDFIFKGQEYGERNIYLNLSPAFDGVQKKLTLFELEYLYQN